MFRVAINDAKASRDDVRRAIKQAHLKDVFSNSGKPFAEKQQGDGGGGAKAREMQATITYDFYVNPARNPKDRYEPWLLPP